MRIVLDKKFLHAAVVLIIVTIYLFFILGLNPLKVNYSDKDNFEKISDLRIDRMVIKFEKKNQSENRTILLNDLQNLIPVSGKWRFLNGVYYQDEVSKSTKTAYFDANTSFGIFSFKFKTEKGTDHTIGFTLASDGTSLFGVSTDFRISEKLINLRNMKDTVIYLSTPYNFLYDQRNDVKIILDTNLNYKLYINGVHIISSDYKIPSISILGTKINLESFNTKAYFSDISVVKPTNNIRNFSILFDIYISNLTNSTISSFLIEKQLNPSGALTYTGVHSFPIINYSFINTSTFHMNDSIELSVPSDLIRPPDIIYFPTEPYNRTFAIRLIARGWDEQKQEWVFKEFMSPEFTWEDVVEGRTIRADGSRE